MMTAQERSSQLGMMRRCLLASLVFFSAVSLGCHANLDGEGPRPSLLQQLQQWTGQIADADSGSSSGFSAAKAEDYLIKLRDASAGLATAQVSSKPHTGLFSQPEDLAVSSRHIHSHQRRLSTAAVVFVSSLPNDAVLQCISDVR